MMKSLAAFSIGLFAQFTQAAEEAKKPEYNPGAFFQSKTVIIPHDDKLHRGGEDAADSNDTFLCVADGVGGWADQGVNPGIFSAELTRSMLMFHENFPDPENDAHRIVFKGCNYAA